jgi:hypothetical protein
LRVSTVATLHNIAPQISATAPPRSIGAPPSLKVRLISAATPTNPIANEPPSRSVILCVRKTTISAIAINAGIVAIITAAIPDGTRCSAQNTSP